MDFGDYRRLSVDDFHVLSQTVCKSFVVVSADEGKAYLLEPGRAAGEMPFLDAGLRHLLANPATWGVLIQNATYSYLEVARSLHNKKEVPRGLESELVIGVLKGRGRRHVGFW